MSAKQSTSHSPLPSSKVIVGSGLTFPKICFGLREPDHTRASNPPQAQGWLRSEEEQYTDSSDDETPLIEKIKVLSPNKGHGSTDVDIGSDFPMRMQCGPTTMQGPSRASLQERQPISFSNHPHDTPVTGANNHHYQTLSSSFDPRMLPFDSFTPWPSYTLDDCVSLNLQSPTEYFPPPESTSQLSSEHGHGEDNFRRDVLEAVGRLRVNCAEASFKVKFLPSIHQLGQQTERIIMRKVADQELERTLLSIDGAACDFRDTVKGAFLPFLQFVDENKWVSLALKDMELKIRTDSSAIIADLRAEVDKIELKDSTLALSYKTTTTNGRTREDIQSLCIHLLDTTFSSVCKIKKLVWELELSIKHELWAIKSGPLRKLHFESVHSATCF